MFQDHMNYFLFWCCMATLAIGLWAVVVVGIWRIISLLEKVLDRIV